MKLKSLLILPFLVASLQAASVDDLSFTLNGNGTEYSVTDCLETAGGSLDIPSTYNNLPVTSIGEDAFGGCTNLTSVAIPNSVIYIGDKAFRDCSSLSSITIPEGVTSIGSLAFVFCSSLSSITIHDGVISIGERAFAPRPDFFWEDTNSIKYLISASGNTAYLIDGSSASGNVVLPNTVLGASVTLIGDGAFGGYSSLTSITIPNSVTSIGNWAFAFCPSLTSIIFEGDAPTFGTGLHTIGANDIIIDPDTGLLTHVDLATIYYDSNRSGWSGITGVQSNTLTFTLNGDSTEYVVTDCLPSASGSLDIPSTYAGLPVTSIGYQAFIFCNSLTSITIPDSVTSIGDGAFLYCNSLNSITIPDSVTSIGDSAFAHCTSLTNIRFDGVAPTIGSQVFSYTQVSYIILEAANAATYGGDGANYGGLTVLDRSKIATAANLYTLGDIQDLRAGSTMIAVENGAATLSIDVEQSSDLGIWTTGGTASVQMNVQPGEDKKFFRFKMNDSDSSNKDINLSIEGSEYDEAAIIQALADQYGVPASSISLSVTGG